MLRAAENVAGLTHTVGESHRVVVGGENFCSLSVVAMLVALPLFMEVLSGVGGTFNGWCYSNGKINEMHSYSRVIIGCAAPMC